MFNDRPTEQVFRVEHKDNGAGPYRPHHSSDEELREFARVLSQRHFDNWHPGPEMDKTVRGYYVWAPGLVDRFGFTSLDALIRWFGPMLDELNKMGFVIRVYQAEVTWEGRTGQCTFYTDTAHNLEMPC